jgi:hypothetical protein
MESSITLPSRVEAVADERPQADIGDTYQWRVTKFGDAQECLSLFIVSTKAGKACNIHVGQLSLDIASVNPIHQIWFYTHCDILSLSQLQSPQKHGDGVGYLRSS